MNNPDPDIHRLVTCIKSDFRSFQTLAPAEDFEVSLKSILESQSGYFETILENTNIHTMNLKVVVGETNLLQPKVLDILEKLRSSTTMLMLDTVNLESEVKTALENLEYLYTCADKNFIRPIDFRERRPGCLSAIKMAGYLLEFLATRETVRDRKGKDRLLATLQEWVEGCTIKPSREQIQDKILGDLQYFHTNLKWFLKERTHSTGRRRMRLLAPDHVLLEHTDKIGQEISSLEYVLS